MERHGDTEGKREREGENSKKKNVCSEMESIDVFALPTLVFITHVLLALRGQQFRRSRDPKNRRAKEAASHSIFVGQTHARYREFLIIRADVIDGTFGIGKNVKDAYARVEQSDANDDDVLRRLILS